MPDGIDFLLLCEQYLRVGFSVRFRFRKQLLVNPSSGTGLTEEVDPLSAGDRK